MSDRAGLMSERGKRMSVYEGWMFFLGERLFSYYGLTPRRRARLFFRDGLALFVLFLMIN